MKRREFLKSAGIGTLALSIPSGLAQAAFGKKKPNIILIMPDDFGYECVTANGGQSYSTPRIDDLAKRGIRFTNCHSQPVCTPTRVKIMTGKTNARNYVAFETLNKGEKTFGHIMGTAGYATAIAGKWQLSGRGKEFPGTRPEDSGFDEYCLWQVDRESKGSRYWNPNITQNGKVLKDTDGKYGPDIYSQFLMDFMTRNKKNPFFIYYPMALTHGPHVPTPDSKEGDSKSKRNTKYFPDMVAYTDKIVGKMVDHLEELGIADDTLLLFTGDNGTDKKVTSKFNGKKIRGGKGRSIDAGTHVPLIAYWEGTAPANKLNTDLIDFSDILPTVAEIGGAKISKDFIVDGVSFVPQLKGKQGHPKEYIFCHFEKGKYAVEDSGIEKKKKKNKKNKKPKKKKSDKPEFTRWVRDERWKLYNNGNFYDVITDPDEKSPLPVGDLASTAEVRRKRFGSVLAEMAKEIKKH
ncbi:MAG: sulfatase-like hydrolase/transferase [Candidatus Marinimicrobia bacterium]|jgi:arylsulfatase A|nr:sulfatase-like hydrolase/transferase [Candidatus Neomarinimicrobiota bacterium]MBT3823593.1 sulfatase-like hydrolase/transferase [Candidatus Neomarinimicrobiota bacterium]MBT4129548.1 sulfatase-like hydrolase/transferase [Candidatus Neomarinimicrobiota bacterium]MBT4295926.1 sulfatase-like hydrolase/transferase [Candidatus Neomarinimicrobiota bacterium]MBT4420072.1 sulfatase-like hydrolase/transferase [Candidatus Neomarinimicrobiota bacterium]